LIYCSPYDWAFCSFAQPIPRRNDFLETRVHGNRQPRFRIGIMITASFEASHAKLALVSPFFCNGGVSAALVRDVPENSEGLPALC